MTVTWNCKSFDALTPHELYAIMQLRIEIFVVEQNCVFQDADNKDQQSLHFMGWEGTKLAAYTRLIPAGISYKEASIGRVVTASWARGNGLGRELMRQSIKLVRDTWNEQAIKIGAQLYLESFYNSLGFQRSSDIYLEDGIEHIEMLLDR